MFHLIKKYFDFNEREMEKLRKTLAEITALEDKVRDLKDEDFPKETQKMRDQIQSGKKTVDDLLPWAYAVAREAARRSLGERHFDVQIMAGIALHQNKVVEQRTGEGKTLTATAPLYLNALAGKGAHLVTVNDYLARRDAGWMGAIFHFLGLTTSAIISDKSYIYDPTIEDKEARDWRLLHLREVSRKEAYAADVTYGINSEFGFDYLRDNMSSRKDDLVQRGFYFAIIDEGDSVLIDEARTPHIISAPYEQDTSKYYQYAKIVRNLEQKTDYIIDEKLKTSNLTEAGIAKIEKALGVSNVYEKDFDTLYHIEAALKAETLFKANKDYIVKDGEVIIVDEFTGRLLQGRRFSEGLHQAIEAKENVSIQRESRTLATVSLQNYFRMYEKLAGMTGTAATEAEEFHKIYKVDVLVMPTHRQIRRKDSADMIYKTEQAKFNAVVEEIVKNHATGRPILVGTTSIEKNEYLSRLLEKRGVPHALLNAKNHEQEASIIARAGEKGAVTVATNMAGRGVDIILGGMPPSRYQIGKEDSKKQEKEFTILQEKWRKNHDEVVELGGLYVIGTERHESRRIDNQLRGRSGRQGDPGESCFFVSLEDDLMRIFGGDQIARMMTMLNFPEDQPLSHPMVSKAMEQAQVKVEGFNFDIRKHLVDFDDVLNKQREIIYELRRNMMKLPEENPKLFKEKIFEMVSEQIAEMVTSYAAIHDALTADELEKLPQDIVLVIPAQVKTVRKYLEERDFEGLEAYLQKSAQKFFTSREEEVGEALWNEIARMMFLTTIDKFWTEHLTAIEDLREGINLRGYAQLDPLIEYKNEAYRMFEKLVQDIHFEAIRRLFHVEIQKGEEPPTELESPKGTPMVYHSASRLNPYQKEEAKPQKAENSSFRLDRNLETNATAGSVPQPVKKLGRNEPCWCGSGKKFKKCHGIGA
ncbi:preprotein translocase subunit SecA [Candidatus Roizmanbacteria bacterium]|nr:preprotein translocase subunit SecA [Candidatus Roizmanbacteria bacterium]